LQDGRRADEVAAEEKAPADAPRVRLPRDQLNRQPEKKRIGDDREQPFPPVVRTKEGDVAVDSKDGRKRRRRAEREQRKIQWSSSPGDSAFGDPTDKQ